MRVLVFMFALIGGLANASTVALQLKDACIVWEKTGDTRFDNGVKTAAKDLEDVIFRKTGRRPPQLATAPANHPAVIYLGTAAERASGVDLSPLRNGDWRVKTAPGKAFLLGCTSFAVTCAMVEFCERYLDHYFLAIDGDDPCVREENCTVPVDDVTVRPAIYIRNLYHGQSDGAGKWIRWSRLRRMVFPYSIEKQYRISAATTRMCHSQFFYIHPDQYFKAHPEYYSMNAKGKRMALFDADSQICYTSEGALEVCYQSLVKFIEKDRAKNPTNYPCIYDFTQHDCCDHLCLCPNCRQVIARYNRVPGGHAEGGDAGLQLEFVNKLARRVRERYPDVQLRVFAYVSTGCPPKEGTIRPEPNVVIWWCDLYTMSDHTLPLENPDHFNDHQAREIDGWLKLTKNIQVWDYMLYSRAFPQVAIDAIAADAKFFGDRGLPHMFMQDEFDFQPFYFLNAFLMSELYIDPSRSVDELIHIYCRVYGAAADKMEAAIQLLRRMQREGRAANASDWHNCVFPWRTRANLEQFARLVQDAHALPNLSTHERARVVDVLASTRRELVTLLKADLKATAECERAKREWVESEKEFAATGFLGDRDRGKYVAKVEELCELMSLTFDDLPEELRGVPTKELVFVDYHRGSPRVKDPKSSRGWTVATRANEPKIDGSKPIHCGVWDRQLKSGNGYTIKKLPPSDSYTWIKMGPAYIGRSSIFWFPASWMSDFNLMHYHLYSDGAAVDPNHYELWISARNAEGRLFIDRLIFRRCKQN